MQGSVRGQRAGESAAVSFAECDETKERRRMKVNATNDKLWVGAAISSKDFVPQ